MKSVSSLANSLFKKKSSTPPTLMLGRVFSDKSGTDQPPQPSEDILDDTIADPVFYPFPKEMGPGGYVFPKKVSDDSAEVTKDEDSDDEPDESPDGGVIFGYGSWMKESDVRKLEDEDEKANTAKYSHRGRGGYPSKGGHGVCSGCPGCVGCSRCGCTGCKGCSGGCRNCPGCGCGGGYPG